MTHMTTRVYTSFSDVPELHAGAVFAAPTDTVYGLSCAVRDTVAITRLKRMKGKGAAMPLIVLIGSYEQLAQFVGSDAESLVRVHERVLSRVWPGPVSVVFKDTAPQWDAISPDTTLAIRMPDREDLRAFISRVGPIVSTSANLHGEAPATTCADVCVSFPDMLDFVIDTGVCANPPSTLVKIVR